MLPIGPLMIEHRLIERMIGLIDKELQRIERENKVNTDFINTATDFFGMYADRCHHGKEEDILFRDLALKYLSSEHERIMNELIKEHVIGRNNVKNLIAANADYIKGHKEKLLEIVKSMNALVKLYPTHIEKEDKYFFIPCMEYFSDKEKDSMLKEMFEFDRKLIHDKYKVITEQLEKGLIETR